mgnify:FL=1
MKKKHLIIIISAVSVVLLIFGYSVLIKPPKIMPVSTSNFMDLISGELYGYKQYLKQCDNNVIPEEKNIRVCNEVAISAGTKKEFSFSVQNDGLYILSCEQKGGNESGYKDIEFSMQIDGEYPFEESQYLYFPKRWLVSESGDIDFIGNQLRPIIKEQDEWYESQARSRSSYVSDPIRFYLKSGTHTISLNPTDLNLELRNLTFKGYKPPKPYTEPDLTGQETNVKPITIQAENALYRSAPSILEQIDRTSAASIPVCSGSDIYNTMGGSTWSERGSSLTWEFKVEQSGYYQLNMRALQDYGGGISSYRRLYIDREIPFEEAQIITVPYSIKWQKVTAMAGDKPAWFFLDEGKHTVTLECTLGEIEDLMEVANNLLKDLNRVYRRIIMVITTNPDPYRDYDLTERIPDVFEEMTRLSKVLDSISGYLIYKGGGSGSQTVLFERLCEQLKDFIKHPEKIQTELNYFQSNISAVGAWISERDSIPLELDWLQFVPAGGSGTEIKVSTFTQIKHAIDRVINSYTNDYNRFATSKSFDKNISVWVNTGRDQLQVINQLCNEFSAEHKVGVNLKLVEPGTVMMAVIAGTGPDVNIMGTAGEPVNYAVRKAVLSLNDMDGFDEVIKDFHPQLLTSLTFMGQTYALPETESFPVMFYRKDIFEELGLKVPKVWDDVDDLIHDLQANNMQFGPYVDLYSILLYQNGGAYYKNNGKYSLLNSLNSIKAFNQWSRFFVNYGLPLEYDFLNRFRTGEVPIAIQEFGMCNSLAVFAPEIKNDWAMTLVPGTVKEDGTVDYSINCGGSCAYIFSKCKDNDSSWKFLRWWVSGRTQSSYATQIEILLGEHARYNVASISAFKNQMWNRQQAEILSEQREWAKGIPQVPGSYFVSRHLNNAFRKVVYSNADVRETLNEYTEIINKELSNKRREFGLGEN